MSTPQTATGVPFSVADFRRVLGHQPTGVALVTTGLPDAGSAAEPVPSAAMVVGTFGSVSLDPPLVCFMPDRSSTTWPLVREAGRFAVSVLGDRHEQLCRAVARKQEDRFAGVTWRATPSGLPVLADAHAWVDCVLHDVVPAGDHDIVLGRVLDLGAGDAQSQPLVFHRGTYGSLLGPR